MSDASTSWSNWARTVTATAMTVAHPTSTAEVADLVRAAAQQGTPVKAVGSGHSFSAAATAEGVRVELDRLSGLVSVDAHHDGETALVTVRGGTPLRVLNELLASHGLALRNLGDIDAQTITGALSTGTHGTGATLGCLSTFLERFDLVTASGDVLRCSARENPDVFDAARVGLGALGVITEVTLRTVPTFHLRARERPAALTDVLDHLDDWINHDHFEFFWFPYTDRVLAKTNDRVEADDQPLARWRGWLDDDFLSNTVFGGVCRLGRGARALVPALNRVSARALSARTYTGRSDRVFCTPRRVRFVEMEYGLPRAALPEAFAGLRRLIDSLPIKVSFPAEVRFAAADDIWLSPGYGRDSVYIAIHQFQGAPYEPYFQGFEQICQDLGGRPHWGKMHDRDARSLAPAYPRFDDFLAVRDRLDPNRVFANSYTRRVLGE